MYQINEQVLGRSIDIALQYSGCYIETDSIYANLSAQDLEEFKKIISNKVVNNLSGYNDLESAISEEVSNWNSAVEGDADDFLSSRYRLLIQKLQEQLLLNGFDEELSEEAVEEFEKHYAYHVYIATDKLEQSIKDYLYEAVPEYVVSSGKLYEFLDCFSWGKLDNIFSGEFYVVDTDYIEKENLGFDEYVQISENKYVVDRYFE